MSKKKRYQSRAQSRTQEHSQAQSTEHHALAFAWDDPEPAGSSRELWDYLYTHSNGKWYEPAVPFNGLAKAFRANSAHESALRFKRNMLASSFLPNALLDQYTFGAWLLDFLVFGNAYLEKRYSKTNRLMGLKHTLAKFTRVAENLTDYYFLQHDKPSNLSGHVYQPWQEPYLFPSGSILHLKEQDIDQEIYGMPPYLSALQSVWLNESATLFRRKYYINGSHAGYILYLNDEKLDKKDVENIRIALKNTRGKGNFRNLFLYSSGANKDGVQIIPLGEATAKDEFLNIKNVSRDDVLIAHRTPPQLLGIVPSNSGGFGDISKAAIVYVTNELLPIQQQLRQLNHMLGMEVVRFKSVEEQLALLMQIMNVSSNKKEKES